MLVYLQVIIFSITMGYDGIMRRESSGNDV